MKQSSVFAPEVRSTSLVLLASIALVAAEALSLLTVAPIVVPDVSGASRLGGIFSSFVLAQLVFSRVSSEPLRRGAPL